MRGGMARERAQSAMGEDAHQMQRALGLGVEIRLLAGHADRRRRIVVMDRNAKSLIEAKVARAHHDFMRTRIALAVVRRILPLEWIETVEATSRNRIGRAEVLAIVELEPLSRPAVGNGHLGK